MPSQEERKSTIAVGMIKVTSYNKMSDDELERITDVLTTELDFTDLVESKLGHPLPEGVTVILD